MLKMEIETDGAAFRNPYDGGESILDENLELERIMKVVTSQILHGSDGGIVMDINGNKVGSWSR